MFVFIFSNENDFAEALNRLNHSDIVGWLYSADGLRIVIYTPDDKEFLVQELSLLGVPETSYKIHKIEEKIPRIKERK